MHIFCISDLKAYNCIIMAYTEYNVHIKEYFWHISCISFAYLTNTVYIFAYFKHIFTYNCIFFAYLCIFLPGPMRSIPASRFAGCSCTIQASPTTTGSCTLFIARKLMRIRPGLATPGRRPGRSPPGPARSPARSAAAANPSIPAATAFLLLLQQVKVAIFKLAQYTSICNICNTC